MTDAFADLISDTVLAGRPVTSLPVPDTDEIVFTIPCSPQEISSAWTAARSLVAVTGRWPVVSSLDGLRDPAEMLWRSSYADEETGEVPTPAEVLDRASSLTAAGAVAAWRARVPSIATEPAAEFLDYHLATTQGLRGSAPSADEVLAAVGPDGNVDDVDKYLYDWETARFGTTSPADRAFEWFDRWSHCAVVFLPCGRGWQTPAYLSYWGAVSGGHENLIAIMRRWSEGYDAELVANWGTMLQFVVGRRPETTEEAWQLAGEIALAADSLQQPRRHIAQYVLNSNRWFLHSRP